MKIIKYVCPKCGCTNVYPKPNETRRKIGVYCAECKSWINWVNFQTAQEIYENLEQRIRDNDKIAIKKITQRDGTTIVRCSKCKCLFYNSLMPRVTGQFDLINAKFCPECGRELL